ncbi:exodeoxyribonuclease III, partial [Enterocytozoon bieneusi H348]
MPYCSDESLIEAVMETYNKLTDVLNKEQHPVVILCGDMNATYSMCDNYLYMREYEQLHYVSEWSMSIDHISKVENPTQREKLHTRDFYMKLQMSSENGIYTKRCA